MFNRYLTSDELLKISNAILSSTGYAYDIRKVFLSDVLLQFRVMLPTVPVERVQLDLDLNRLNETERLTNGTIPFQAWLNRAEQYVQTDPQAQSLIQQAQANIGNRSGQVSLDENSSIPSERLIEKIVKEKIILQNDLLSYSFLETGVKAGNSVVKLKIPRYDNGSATGLNSGEQAFYSGTGWLLTRQLLITNHHVVNARAEGEPNATNEELTLQTSNSIAEFDFNTDNTLSNSVAVGQLEVWDEKLDFAILRLANEMDRLPLSRFPQEIIINSGIEGKPMAVNIIQHPFGHSKKIAIRNNHIYETHYPQVFYFTDTDKGSSGSPVFNDRWQVIALHRASKPVTNVAYQGKITGWVNEGVQLKAIFDWLKENCERISNEIINN